MVELLNGLNDINIATTAKKKYQCLLDKLQKVGLITVKGDGKIEVVQAEYAINIVYLQPNNVDGQENVISFHEAAEIIEQQDDGLSKRFAQSLREWASIKAGEC